MVVYAPVGAKNITGRLIKAAETPPFLHKDTQTAEISLKRALRDGQE